MSGASAILPVFTSPAEQIRFYADEPPTYQQVLTIVNPYEYTLTYAVSAQASDNSRYTIDVPKATIMPKHTQSIIIRHNSITSDSLGVVDKLKIFVTADNHGIRFHRKELPMTLYASRRQSADSNLPLDVADFISYQSTETKSSQSSRQHPVLPENRHGSDTDIIKKLQGYLIAFILGYLACLYWKS